MQVPKYVERLFKDNTRYVHEDQRYGPVGYVLRVYPSNLYAYRATFRDQVERAIRWATRHHAEAKIISIHMPGFRVKCRAEDYIMFVCTDPVAVALERQEIIPM